MSHPADPRSVADLALSFVARVLPDAPSRLEAKVLGQDGMPVLCAVEAALTQALPRSAQELVWLSGAPPAGRPVLRLRAFGAVGQLLAETVHELPVQA